MNRKVAILLATLLTFGGSLGQAATFVYNRTTSNTSGTADQWSAGTNWDATPVSASDTTLTFGNGASLAAGATIFSNNDIAADFQLNRLNFTYAGPGSGAAQAVTISGNRLEFINNGVTAPILNVSATGTAFPNVAPTLTIANDLVLTNDLNANVAVNNSVTLNGLISGGGALKKNSVFGQGGTLTLSGANTYTGGTMLSAGTLILNNSSAIGTGTLTINGFSAIANKSGSPLTLTTNNPQIWDATFVLGSLSNPAADSLNLGTGPITLTGNREVRVGGLDGSSGFATFTVGGVIGDGGSGFSLTKEDIGTLILTGTSTYSGGTIIRSGGINVTNIANAGVPGNIGTGIIRFGGNGVGTLRYLGAGETTDKVVDLANSFRAQIEHAGTGLLKFTGDFISTSTATKTLELEVSPAGMGEISGAIVDNSAANKTSLNKVGFGTWVLSGANTYSGKTTITSGLLSVSSLNSVVGGSASSNLGAPKTVADGTIDLIGFGGSGLIYTGTGETTDRVINLAGTTFGGGITQSGTGLLKFTSDITATGAGSKAIGFAGSTAGTGEFAGRIVNNSPINTTGVSKSGTGTWILSGDNAYTGTTNIVGGTLLINGNQSAATGQLRVNDTATLGGTGTIGASTVFVNSGGTLSPGASPGILHMNGNLTLAAGALYLVDINGTSVGSEYDQTGVIGTVNLGDATLSLNFGFDPVVGDRFTIIENGGTDPVLGMFDDLPEGAMFASGGDIFKISYQGGTGNDVVLTAAVPEPATIVMLTVTAAGVSTRRRSRSTWRVSKLINA
jgi:autotransporter-associated beta strand protein